MIDFLLSTGIRVGELVRLNIEDVDFSERECIVCVIKSASQKVNGKWRFREMGKKLGVGKVHPHEFRRTMATRVIEKGMPIEQVQKILGHEQIDTTPRYAMVN